jgi:autotransporter-associated beta strand protein
MSKISRSRLMATSAIAGLSILQLPAAHAQDAFGVHNDQPDTLEVVVGAGEEVEGDDIGVYADNGAVVVDNAGTIRGNGPVYGSIDSRPSGGVVIAQPGSSVTNSGTISGTANGVTTSYFFGEDAEGESLPAQALATDTTVTNSGLIRGEAGSGVALIGGGDVVNSGTIQGLNGTIGNGAQGNGVVIAEFPEAVAEGVTGIGSLTNSETGLIEGQLFGALLQGGGTIDNAGIIRSTGAPNPAMPNVSPFGLIVGANASQEGRSATVNNSGTISGFLGLLAGGTLESATINNTGLITANQAAVFGLNSGALIVNNDADGQIVANGPAIVSNAGTLTVDNAGLIRSNAQAGINITTANAVIDNSGTIQGGTFGITTNPFQVGPGVFDDRSVNTTVTNSGAIIGLNNDGIRLQGGGSVTNSGMISGQQNVQADGVSIFSLVTQDLETYSATVANTADGSIDGNRFGVIISSGGTLDNAGTIGGNAGGVVIQNGLAADDITGTLTNSGTITGHAGMGVAFDGLATATLGNSGTIEGHGGDGVYATNLRDGVAIIDNDADGVITGAQSGVHVEQGGLTLTNAGTIRGDGGNLGFDAPPDAGVTISGSVNTITNSGTISGNRFGITTANYFNPATGQLEGLATGTTVVNSGTIIGDNDDGVRLIGGGSVTNSGTIEGRVEDFADGVSMFAYTNQANEDYSAAVSNEADGTIAGARFGVILSGGGDVTNAGSITGVVGGVFVQGTAINSDPGEDRSGLVGRVVNSGTITGTGPRQALGSGNNGYGVGFGSDMSTAILDNSGSITSEQSVGVLHGSLADLTITNAAGGVITGATSGIYGSAGGTLVVNNAGTIRGEGTYDGFAAPPDAGITIGTADSSVTNSGTISGAGAGITTAYLFDEDIGQLVFLAAGTTVVNSGTIRGEANDGVRLIGGGSVTNSGTIRGEGSALADGVSIYPFDQQVLENYAGVVTNSESGDISGERFGIILSGGGTIDNAGTITGDGPGGVLIQRGTGLVQESGHSGLLTNSGTIAGTNGYGAVVLVTDNATIANSGTITGATSGAVVEGVAVSADIAQTGSITNSGTITGSGTFGVATAGALDTAEIVNSGTISGATDGVILGNFGHATLTNSGTITGGGRGVWGDDSGPVRLDNAGTIAGGSGVAVQLGSFDDSVILRTGSSIDGVVDAGAGTDGLTLDGDILELTAAQQIGATANFETLDVAAGYWSTSGVVGTFDAVTIAEGAALQVNEVDLGDDGLSSPILTSAVTTNGRLVLNFSGDDQLSELDALSVTGTGVLQLIGEAVFTVDTDTLTHTGGTTVSNGGLILTGTLLGDVRTEGDGAFQLGAGGTEGNFAGNIVNDGTFVFNRSDDYDFLGAFSGTGTLVKDGNSVLSFLGDYGFTGLTSILAGSVRIGGVIDPGTDFNLGGGSLDISGTNQTIGGLSGGGGATVIIDDSELTIDQDENTSFAGDIAGNGSLTKDGDGILNLTGTNSYTGPTNVNGGTLAINGSITSGVTVNTGGTLGGNGSVGDTTVNGGGTLAPGNSIGRLTVNGDLALAAGSVYQVEVNAAGQGDRVDATGAVTIAGTAKVEVLAENGNYRPRTDYVILTGATGVTGRFGSVTSDLAFLNPFLRYGSNAVTLSLYRNDIDFADVAANANQVGVAHAVQALGIDNPLFETVLVQNATTAQATFGDLSGEILASSVSGLTDDSRHLRNALLDLKGPEESGAFVWGSAFGGWGDFDAAGGRFAMDTDHKGFVAGIGYGGQGFAAALSAGIGSSDFNQEGRSDRADVESKYLAAHATYGTGEGIRAAFGVSYAWHDIDSSRAVGAAPLAQTLVSQRDADTLQVFGELGYDARMGKAAVTPFIRLAHVSTDADGVTETGGNAALVVSKAEQKATFLSLGARVRFNAGEGGFQPYLSAAWNRTFDDRAAAFDARFAAGGPGFTILGVAIPKDSAEVEAGFDYSTGNFRIGAAYTGTLASDRTSHGARITARIAF